MYTIDWNGSRWAGQAPATLEDLFTTLRNHPLDPRRAHVEGIERDGKRLVHAWGNFEDVSHGFGVTTDDPVLAARFVAAFAANRELRAHACMGEGAAARAAAKCPCWESHFGRFREEGDPEPPPPGPIGEPVDKVVTVAPALSDPFHHALWSPLVAAGLLVPCAELGGAPWYELSGAGCYPEPAAPPTNPHQEKRARRVERLRGRAAKLRGQAQALESRASRAADAIPFGQPILVGHHSEKRDRRYRERIRKTFTKAAETAREAAEVERRADAAARNSAVSSDDPEAVSLLRDKLAQLERAMAGAKAANKLLRASAHPPPSDVIRECAALVGWTPERMASWLGTLHSMGRRTLSTTNGGAERRRLIARIEALQLAAAKPAPEPETVGEVRIAEEDNRVRVYFPGKPPEAIRAACKARGFRWSPSAGAWQRHASSGAWHAAREVAAMAGAS